MIKFGIIGLGRFANNYIRVLNDFYIATSVPILCSRSNKSLYNLKEKPQNKHIHTKNYKEVCENEKIDAVIICTPPSSHYEITKEALLNGKHVICEKPFVFKTEEAVELKNIADDKQLCLVVDYIHLWNDFYQKARNFAKNKEIESVNFHVENPKTGREHHSVLWDWLTHDFSMLLHLLNEKNVVINDKIFNGETILKSDKIILRGSSRNANWGISCDINSEKKRRSVNVKLKNGDEITTHDLFNANPLQELLVDFINALQNNVKISNIDLAISITNILNSV